MYTRVHTTPFCFSASAGFSLIFLCSSFLALPHRFAQHHTHTHYYDYTRTPSHHHTITLYKPNKTSHTPLLSSAKTVIRFILLLQPLQMFHSKLRTLWRPALACLSATGTINILSKSPLCHHRHHDISRADIDHDCQVDYDSDEKLLNWSSTHSSTVSKLYVPSDEMEVMRLLQHHTKHKAKLRPVGTALSPNVRLCPHSSPTHKSLYSCYPSLSAGNRR